MRFQTCVFAAAAAAAVLALPARAADWGASASVGTTGLSLHVSRALTPALNLRLGPSFLRYSTDTSTSDVDYDLKLKLRTFDVLLDYFPGQSAFRVSAGLAWNGNRFDAVGRPNASGTFNFNGNVFPASTVGTVNGDIDFRTIAPYLGIGWGKSTAVEKGWGFSADLGVLFQGSPRSNLSNSGCTGSAAICAQIATDIAAENQRLNDELRDYRYFPVVRVGVHYGF